MSMKALPDMIAIDVMRNLWSIDRQIDWIHSQQVWVSGYKNAMEWSNDAYIYESTVRYDYYWCNADLM